jgi:dTMP kinase
VLCDRFTDATYAYQGGGKGVATAHLADLERWVHGDCQPDLTLLFDLPIEVARARLAKAHESGRTTDKFERERDAFFERVRAAYHARAEADPHRIRVIAAGREPAEVRAAITEALATL